jgi:tRNA-2-methylthio-N6-dimethylallyladenosine synthase
MVGMAFRDKTGLYLKKIREKLPGVDEFMPIEEVGFDFAPLRTDKLSAWVPISNGCNNFCTYCVVPFTRGREISRPFDEIINECRILKKRGYRMVTLLGQNVNSYGTDLINNKNSGNVASEEALREADCGDIPQSLAEEESHKRQNIKKLKPIYVKHLGRYRIPTLFPYLLEEVAKMGFEKVDFISSNPWDFSDELIDVIARNKNITRTIHLPVQSGDDAVLKRMNRWYTAEEYLLLVSKIKDQIATIKFTTDIIVGFCGETDEEFENTLKLCKKAGFSWAYVSVYSQRPMTASTKIYKDDVPHKIKDKRWKILDDLINKPHLKKMIK